MQNKRLKRIINTYSVILLSCIGHFAFSQGINPYIGTSSAVSKLESITPEGFAHPGYVIGVDARLNEGKMYFYGGGQFHKISFAARDGFSLTPDGNTFNWLKFRVGLGYDLFYLSEGLFVIRGKTLASFDFISGVPDTASQAYNDGVAGLVFGLGTDISMFTFDIEYELGMFNAVNKVADSKFDFVNFTVGVIF